MRNLPNYLMSKIQFSELVIFCYKNIIFLLKNTFNSEKKYWAVFEENRV